MENDVSGRFEGKVAVVTGAGGGIGEGYARALAAEGAAVIVAELDEPNGRRVADAITDEGGRALFVRTDVASPESATAMVAAAEQAFGGIDYLVNNAAIYKGMTIAPLVEMDWDYYQRFMAVNMNGALVVTRATVPSMLRRGGGAIVNQSSSAAWMSYNLYSIPKLALHGITQVLARELGPKGIRVNAVAPGPIDTDATRTSLPEEGMLEGILATMPIGRLGTVEEIAKLCLFLLSDDAAFITGQIYAADGGQLMRP